MSERCALDTRRTLLRRSQLNGLDEVEVEDDRRTLLVRFFHDAPDGLSAANLRITGGVAVRHIRITDIQPVASDDPDVPTRLEVSLDRTGDASSYRLQVTGVDGIDQRYSEAPFLFFPEADDGLDCADTVIETPPATPPPPLNYLAKDYPGFRQLILDRLAVTLPEWRESHIPDVGIMIVELMAYVADRLSYYQDAVATEAYLGTARRRISVRRHVRLIDYAMHEGCNARALVQIEPTADAPIMPSQLTFLLAGADDAVQFRALPVPGDRIDLRPAHTKMRVHTWGDADCVLPKGAVSATLVDPDPVADPPSLHRGDYLIFEVLAAGPDSDPDPDPQSRHAVRLTRVVRFDDPLLQQTLLQVSWSPEDALPAAFPLDAASPHRPVTVVRGNLLLVDHGRCVSEGRDRPVLPRIGPGRRRTIALSTPGLGFAELPVAEGASARRVLNERDPRSAMPLIEELRSWPVAELRGWPVPDADAYDGPKPLPTDWVLRPDLIESGPDDPHATVEIDDDGTVIIRFGDGVCGRDPSGQAFAITYRVGNGPGGNVGADRIARLRSAQPQPTDVRTVRNPLPASGGTAPEDVEQVRFLAQHAFHDTLMRAITADDYAALAQQLEPSVQRATCILVPSGGRQLARIAIDPSGSEAPDEALERRVAAALESYRRVGHDVTVVRGDYVPLLLVLRVELADGSLQAHLRAVLRAAMGTRVLPDGRLAAFHPDNLTFGTPIYGSRLLAVAQALDGVRAVSIVELARLFDRERGVYSDGVLRMAWYEIPQLDNDPLRPDRGRLVLQLVGGLA
jgi:hypothetical protein